MNAAGRIGSADLTVPDAMALRVSEAAKVFDEHGTLTDEKLREQVQAFMAGFVEFIKGA